jgi:hypothetical protein
MRAANWHVPIPSCPYLDGAIKSAVTDAQLLWFLLPAHLHEDPAPAAVLDEVAAGKLRDRLTSRTAGELLVAADWDVPEVEGDTRPGRGGNGMRRLHAR